MIEDLSVESEWADVVISNGVINLCPDNLRVYKEIRRVLKPGGRMTVANICVEKPVPEGAPHRHRSVDRLNCWCAACAGWETVIKGAGLVDGEFAGEVDTFAGADGEDKARQFGTVSLFDSRANTGVTLPLL